MTLRGGLQSAAFTLVFLQFTGFSQTMPADPDSLFASALSLQRDGKYDDAMTRVRILLRDHPEYDGARILYGRLLAWRNQYDAALSELDSVLTRRPMNADARFAKAQVLAWSGQYDRSADLLDSLRKDGPDNPVYAEELGKVNLWRGNPDLALASFERAYQLDPRSTEAVRGIARVHRQRRSFGEARSWYRKLLELSPDDSEAKEEAIRLSYQSTYELQIQGTYESFTKSGTTAHTVAQLELFTSISEAWKPFLHYSREEKFGLGDHRFGFGSYIMPGYSFTLFLQGIVAANAKVAPQADLTIEADAGIGGGIEALAGYRFLRFDSVSVHVVHPGLTYYFSGEFWLTGSAFLGFTSINTTSNAYLLTCSYLPSPRTTVRTGIFAGSEAFRATTLAELSTVRSQGGFLGVKTRMSDVVVIEGLYQFTAHGAPSSAHLLTLTMTFLF